MSLGRIVLALSCNSFIAIQRENLQQSMELVTSNYRCDTNKQNHKSVHVIEGGNNVIITLFQ